MNANQLILAAIILLGIATLISGLFCLNKKKTDALFDGDREFADPAALVCTDCGSPDVLYVAPLLCGCCHVKRVAITRGCEIAGLTRRHSH